MKIITLNPKNVVPLYPPGVVVNRIDTEELTGRFTQWLRLHNRQLSDMENPEIYDRLFLLLGGNRTPANMSQVPRFHGILNDCYFAAIRLKQAATIAGNRVAPLLPPNIQ